MADPTQQQRDLILHPQEYAFITKGVVSVLTGPSMYTMTAQDQAIMWTGKRYTTPSDIDEAKKQFVRATESQYIVLTDPAEGNEESFPPRGGKHVATDLQAGKKIVIPGPASFALWPGQSAEVIDGHHLSYNEYLLVQVYEPDEAMKNVGRAIAAPQTQGDEDPDAQKDPEKSEVAPKATQPQEEGYTMGERMIIRGDQISYYVPPTGIEVIPEEGSERSTSQVNKLRRSGPFVREAATLEQLEYCVLVDESGAKRYERGPKVVFPEPTETFLTEKGERKFRAMELNTLSGLYIKAIASYEHHGSNVEVMRAGEIVTVSDGDEIMEGDELFITGDHTPIYYPRAELSVIIYGKDNRKHHAVAIPRGEGRYVLDRMKGKIETIKGPIMFLADPRTEVAVRRVLDPRTVEVFYPGNEQAAAINAAWYSELASAPDDFLPVEDVAAAAAAMTSEAGSLARSYNVSSAYAGEKMRRRQEFTPPRTITLDTKYQGAVGVSVWPGYAVMRMDKSGKRQVVVGQQDILLEYDETLMVLTLSTGRPKTDDNQLRTVYLRVINNAVTDSVLVETEDFVQARLTYSLRVNFVGENDHDRQKWFDVEDYVALLTDHCRSRLRNVVKRYGIQEFYDNSIDIIRDTLLGAVPETTKASTSEGLVDVPASILQPPTRPGRTFTENNMHLYDVEVLGVALSEGVSQLLQGAMTRALEGSIVVRETEEATKRIIRIEAERRRQLEETDKTAKARADVALKVVDRRHEEAQREEQNERSIWELNAATQAVKRDIQKADTDQELALLSDRNNVEMARLRAEVEQYIERMKAHSPQLIAAIHEFGQEAFVERLMKSMAGPAAAAGIRTSDMLARFLEGTPYGTVLETINERPLVAAANGGTRAEDGEE